MELFVLLITRSKSTLHQEHNMSIIAELFDDFKFIINYRRSKVSEQKKIDRQAPRVGDLAPDFTLTDSSGTGSVTLSDFRGEKSVVLVFGSFT